MLNNSQVDLQKSQSLAKFVLMTEFVIGLSFVIIAIISYFVFFFSSISISETAKSKDVVFMSSIFILIIHIIGLMPMIPILIISFLNYRKIAKVKDYGKYENMSFIFIKNARLILLLSFIIWLPPKLLMTFVGSHAMYVGISFSILSYILLLFGLGSTLILIGNFILFYEKLNKIFKAMILTLTFIPYISIFYIALKFDINISTYLPKTLEKIFSDMAYSFFIGTLICGLAIILHAVMLYINVKKFDMEQKA